MLQFLRTPQLLLMPPILGALFLFIFRYIFGGAISTGTSVDYVDFLVSGFLVQTVLWTAMNIPAGVSEDSSSGVYDRLRSLPIPRSAVMAGRSLADTALNSWAITVTALLGVAVGFRSNAQAAQAMATLIVVPLTFVSNAFVPVVSMPGWLQDVAANQPVSVIINAVRSLMLGGTDAAGVGHSTTYWVVLSLLWCAGIGAVFSGLAVARFARTR
jgi:ABC-type multidrug transport system permease subunit